MELFSNRAVLRLILTEMYGRISVPNSSAVAQYLPYLRRYARALTGNQASGDAYVAATLEALVKEPALLETSPNPRVSLFRLCSAIGNSLSVNDAADRVVNLVPAERHLGHVTPRPRQAF